MFKDKDNRDRSTEFMDLYIIVCRRLDNLLSAGDI